MLLPHRKEIVSRQTTVGFVKRSEAPILKAIFEHQWQKQGIWSVK
jgi:hypothetical protein